MHATPECLGTWPLGAKAMPFWIAAPTTMRVACAVLEACPVLPPMSLTTRRMLGVSAQVARLGMGQGLCQ
jgi:hypothetical protein